MDMKCTYCLNKKTEVINSRPMGDGLTTWRRRECPNCGRVFTTRESAKADNLFVIKRNGQRQRFLYEKLFVSIFAAIFVGKNADSGDAAKRAKKIAERVIRKIYASPDGKNAIATSAMIVLVFQELKKIGSSYASQYAHYSDYRLKVALKEKLLAL